MDGEGMTELPVNRIICGNALEILKKFPDESVDLVFTSPPYYLLRDYGKGSEIEWPDGTKCQLGLEPSPNLYVEHLGLILKEIYRVLKREGNFFLNIGDCYAGQQGKRYGWSDMKNISKREYPIPRVKNILEDVPERCMFMIPERVMFKCVEIGFILRDKIIWAKYPPKPESVKNRFTQVWEYVYHFTKIPSGYYFDLESVKKPYSQYTIERIKRFLIHGEHFDPSRHKHGDFGGQNPFEILENVVKSCVSFNYRVREGLNERLDKKFGDMYKISEEEREKYDKQGRLSSKWLMDKQSSFSKFIESERQNGCYLPCNVEVRKKYLRGETMVDELDKLSADLRKNPGNLWITPASRFKGLHFATFPPELCEMVILSGSPKGGVVLDPFCGSGTTCAVAKKLGRKYIGIDIVEDYCKMAKERLEPSASLADFVSRETADGSDDETEERAVDSHR